MKEIIDRYPEHFTQTGGEGVELSGTDSAEAALLLILEQFVDKLGDQREAITADSMQT